MTPSIEEQKQLGLTAPPPGEQEIDPKTRIKRIPVVEHNIYRQQVRLSDSDKQRVIDTLEQACREWKENSSNLLSKLRRINELTSGVRGPKDFPWRNSSNLHVPLMEMHIDILWSSVNSTVLKMDPIWTVRTEVPGLTPDDSIDPKIEDFLNYKTKVELKLDRKMSEVYSNAFRDPLALANMEWIENVENRFDVKVYTDANQFAQDYPSPEEANLSTDVYLDIHQALLKGEPVHLRVQEDYVCYRGPALRVIELKDMVLWPATSPSFDYAQFVGDRKTYRSAYFKKGIKDKWFDEVETQRMLDKKTTGTTDTVTQSQDRIEGLTRNSMTDEHEVVNGLLKIDLNNDGEEEKYLVVFNTDSKALIRIEMFPYWHNRCNYIPFKVKRKSNRLLGECVYDWLFDINEEVDTQHNQRIDSRTITTVPSFKKKQTAMFDPTRNDQKFYPGVTFTVTNMDEIQQFDIKQTDIASSMQEETWLFQIAEYRTGASLLRSGRETPRDPRAPAKKVLALLSMSSARIDPYIDELKDSTCEVARQMLELYYQFSPDSILYPTYDPIAQQWLQTEIKRSYLRSNSMTIDIARSTVDDNPDAIAQRRLVEYNILLNNPLIRNNLVRLHALTRELVISLRKRNANVVMPPLEEFLKEMEMQGKMMQSGQMPPNALAMMGNLLNMNQGQGPTGRRQGGPDVSPESVNNSPSPGGA